MHLVIFIEILYNKTRIGRVLDMEGKKRFSSITSTLKFISGIVSWIVLVILLLIAAFFIYYYISVKIYEQKGDKYKPLFSLYTILSPSMVPNINVYDVISK